MKVLVACEYSGIVRDAFIAKGHEAMSCDLLPTEKPGPHYQGDVFDIINDGWDLMIAHPPCTHLAVSGAAWFEQKKKDGRQQTALDFVRRLMNANINLICVENPVSIISSHIRKPYQIVRTYSAGVFAGYIESRNGREIVMRNARRLWMWAGAASLSQLAMEGTSKPSECKFPCEVDKVELLEVIEILDCTEKAAESIKGVSVWKQ